jgi:hypothetical protein
LAVRVVAPLVLGIDWSTKESLRVNLAPTIKKYAAFAPL